MRFIRGHNSYGMDRSGPRIKKRWTVEDRGYETPCWIWQLRIGKHGYGMLGVKGRDWLAHRWHYSQAKGPIPDGLQIDHLCGIRECVNPDHLEPVTALTNTRRGRSLKLTPAEMIEIYERRRGGETTHALAVAFGISPETVRLIGINGPFSRRRPKF